MTDIIKVDKDGFVKLKDVLKGSKIKPKDVVSYEFTVKKDKSIILKLFDKDENEIFPFSAVNKKNK